MTNVTMDTTMLGRWKKRLLSLTLGSKEKLPSLVLLWPPRIRQTYFWWPHLPRHPPPNHLCSLLPRDNSILYKWIFLPS